MIDGAQIRQSRALLRWTTKQLARAGGVRCEAVERAEASVGELPLTIAHAHAIRRALQAAGVEFVEGAPGVQLTRPPAGLFRRRRNRPGIERDDVVP
jgi:transcriptional regulator with XRE-family HTH domain